MFIEVDHLVTPDNGCKGGRSFQLHLSKFRLAFLFAVRVASFSWEGTLGASKDFRSSRVRQEKLTARLDLLHHHVSPRCPPSGTLEVVPTKDGCLDLERQSFFCVPGFWIVQYLHLNKQKWGWMLKKRLGVPNMHSSCLSKSCCVVDQVPFAETKHPCQAVPCCWERLSDKHWMFTAVELQMSRTLNP